MSERLWRAPTRSNRLKCAATCAPSRTFWGRDGGWLSSSGLTSSRACAKGDESGTTNNPRACRSATGHIAELPRESNRVLVLTLDVPIRPLASGGAVRLVAGGAGRGGPTHLEPGLKLTQLIGGAERARTVINSSTPTTMKSHLAQELLVLLEGVRVPGRELRDGGVVALGTGPKREVPARVRAVQGSGSERAGVPRQVLEPVRVQLQIRDDVRPQQPCRPTPPNSHEELSGQRFVGPGASASLVALHRQCPVEGRWLAR